MNVTKSSRSPKSSPTTRITLSMGQFFLFDLIINCKEVKQRSLRSNFCNNLRFYFSLYVFDYFSSKIVFP